MTLLPLLILSHLLAYVLDDNFICRAARMPLSVAHSHWLFIFVSLVKLGDTARDGQREANRFLKVFYYPVLHHPITCIGYY